MSKQTDRDFRKIVNAVVEDRDKNGTERDDLLQVILGLRDKYGRDAYNETAIVGHSMTFLVRKSFPVTDYDCENDFLEF